MQKSFIKIDSSLIKEGMRFSAPVFFDDGSNMFLAEGKATKAYHVAALKRWKIPYLLTYGHEVTENEEKAEPLEELDTLEEL